MGTKQIPYAGYFSASWYNREESHLEQLEVFSESSFLIAQNMILHLSIIPQRIIHNNKYFLCTSITLNSIFCK